jgi:hypothetical protein
MQVIRFSVFLALLKIFVLRLKWKPPSENSIDFKLVLRFPPSQHDPSKPDFHAKPIFLLHTWTGGEKAQAKYELYDELHVEDDEWERFVFFQAFTSVDVHLYLL